MKPYKIITGKPLPTRVLVGHKLAQPKIPLKLFSDVHTLKRVKYLYD